MERNIGHDYTEDVEKRMSVMSRNCIKTNWTEIDTIMDGGLGPDPFGPVSPYRRLGLNIVFTFSNKIREPYLMVTF